MTTVGLMKACQQDVLTVNKHIYGGKMRGDLRCRRRGRRLWCVGGDNSFKYLIDQLVASHV